MNFSFGGGAWFMMNNISWGLLHTEGYPCMICALLTDTLICKKKQETTNDHFEGLLPGKSNNKTETISDGCVLWHINLCRLFNAKSCLYIYMTYKLMVMSLNNWKNIWFSLIVKILITFMLRKNSNYIYAT